MEILIVFSILFGSFLAVVHKENERKKEKIKTEESHFSEKSN